MTKINKLGKSTFVIAILSFLLVAVLAFGGTYAYFSAQSKTVSGEITTGHLRITGIEESGKGSATLASTTKIAQPNEIIYNAKQVDTTVNSNVSYYTRVRFTVDVDVADGHTHAVAGDACGDHTENNIDILKIDILNGGLSGAKKGGKSNIEWESSVATEQAAGTEVIYYQLAPTVIANKDAATAAADKTESFTFTIQVRDWVGNNGLEDGTNVGAEGANDDTKVDLTDGCEYWMDATVTVKVVVEVLQADYLVNGTTQVTEADAFESGAKAHEAWEKALGTTKDNSVSDGTAA